MLNPSADVASNGGVFSMDCPQSQRRSLTSPWAAAVCGDFEPTSPSTSAAEQASVSEVQAEIPDVNSNGNASKQRRVAWNRPINGVAEPASVMGVAVSWPALSETTRSFPISSTYNPRPFSDGSASSSQVSIISLPPQQPSNKNLHGNSAVSNPPIRHRRNRNGGGSSNGGANFSSRGPSQATFNQPSLPMSASLPVFEVPYGMVPAMVDTTVRGARPVRGSQSHTGNDHSLHWNNNLRRGNYASCPRADEIYHNNNNNHGGRGDQDRRESDHHPAQYSCPPMGYMSSPLPPGPFMAPLPLRVFPGFDMASPFIYVPAMPPESFRAMPVGPLPPPIPFSLTNEYIVKQIDFYFSDDNLVKDNYLRSNMDDQGWVPIALIASFRRVQQLTNDIPVILESLRLSTVVEVKGDKLRKRDGWNRWLHSWHNSDSGTNAASSSAPENVLANSIQEVSLDDATTKTDYNMDAKEGQPEMATTSFLYDELTCEARLTIGEDAADATCSNRD